MLSVSAVKDSATISKSEKLRNRTMAWNIPRVIDEIFRELLAYLKCFDEFCIKVVHVFELDVLDVTKLLRISDMHIFTRVCQFELIPATG